MENTRSEHGEVQPNLRLYDYTDTIDPLLILMIQGLILGYLSYTQQTLAMKVSNDGTTFGAFPRLVDVKPRVIHANT